MSQQEERPQRRDIKTRSFKERGEKYTDELFKANSVLK